MHPVLDEFCRINSLQNFQVLVFRKLQRLMRDEVQPLLDEREKLIEHNHALLEEVASLKAQLEGKRAARKPATVNV